MTITHTVVFRLVHPSGSAAEQAFLADARQTLSAIGGVEHFTIARQVSSKSPMDFQFSMRFADQSAYDAYNTHPAHTSFVAERWVPEVAEFQEYDFEDSLSVS